MKLFVCKKPNCNTVIIKNGNVHECFMLMHRCLKLASLPGYQEEQKSFPVRKETQEQPAPAEAAHTVETPQSPHTTEPDIYGERSHVFIMLNKYFY